MTLRIKTLALTDFRAFPGGETFTFELGSKNLLVYGDNGSGKSSVFYALREFFALNPSRTLSRYKNVFSGEPEANCKVEVTFDDDLPGAVWNFGQHPCDIGSSDVRVVDAALRCACLDYRALLDTNYKHGDGNVNLFEIAVRYLIHGFKVTVSGGFEKTVGKLWEDVENAKPVRHYSNFMKNINNACAEFNNGFQQAVEALNLYISGLLFDLTGVEDVEVSLKTPPGVTYNKVTRSLDGQELGLEISFHKHPLARPQQFLNEARLSALGLAIYFAGRLACVPKTTSALKLLVLDDLLISLDYSNRIPVLDALDKHFPDWQVVLLTHDRFWYETVKLQANLSKAWKSTELFEGHDKNNNFAPHLDMMSDSTSKDYLNKAKDYAAKNDIRAAAVYARSAFETILKKFCDDYKLPIQFSLTPQKLDTNVFLNAIKKWVAFHQAGSAFAGIFALLDLYRSTVLNPGSHTTPTSLNRKEIEAAVRALKFISETNNFGKNSLEIAAKLFEKTAPIPEEYPLIAGYLRAAFIEKLRKYCSDQNLLLPFSMQPEKTSAQDLWDAAKPSLSASHSTFVTSIEANKEIFLDPLDRAKLTSFTKPQLKTALDAFATKQSATPTFQWVSLFP
jgi:AAA domain